VFSMVRAESGGDPRAVSSKGAKGLMQIMPAAESDVLERRGWAKGDLFDPDYNLKTGTAYLRLLANQFDDDWELSVAAYHMGARSVKDLRARHPGPSSRELIQKHANRTTAAYVERVLRRKAPSN